MNPDLPYMFVWELTDYLSYILPLVTAQVQESKSTHTRTFQASACFTPVNNPIGHDKLMDQFKAKGSKVHCT